jgi:hypothetical protein
MAVIRRQTRRGRRDQVSNKIGERILEKIEQTNINHTELNKKRKKKI